MQIDNHLDVWKMDLYAQWALEKVKERQTVFKRTKLMNSEGNGM